MKKIETVTLKELEVVQNENGEFEQRFVNEKKYPAAITNYSLHLGEKLGLIEGSQLTDLLKLAELEKVTQNVSANEITEEALMATDRKSVV